MEQEEVIKLCPFCEKKIASDRYKIHTTQCEKQQKQNQASFVLRKEREPYQISGSILKQHRDIVRPSPTISQASSQQKNSDQDAYYQCPLCNQELPLQCIDEHEQICSSRLETCRYCNNNFLAQFIDQHFFLCEARNQQQRPQRSNQRIFEQSQRETDQISSQFDQFSGQFDQYQRSFGQAQRQSENTQSSYNQVHRQPNLSSRQTNQLHRQPVQAQRHQISSGQFERQQGQQRVSGRERQQESQRHQQDALNLDPEALFSLRQQAIRQIQVQQTPQGQTIQRIIESDPDGLTHITEIITDQNSSSQTTHTISQSQSPFQQSVISQSYSQSPFQRSASSQNESYQTQDNPIHQSSSSSQSGRSALSRRSIALPLQFIRNGTVPTEFGNFRNFVQFLNLLMSGREGEYDYSNNGGLSKDELEQLPIGEYKKSTNQSDENQKCSICMCEYEENEKMRFLVCLHRFHVDCIDSWLKKNTTCPVCKKEQSLHNSYQSGQDDRPL